MEHLCSSLEFVTAKYRKAVMWVCGELNLPDIDWKTQSIVGNSNPVFINQRFLDCVHHCGLEQKLDFPTRQAATLDFFLTNRPTLVDKCSAASSIADHYMVQIAASVSAKRNKPVARKIFLLDKTDMKAVRTSSWELASEFSTKFSTSSPIETMWTFINERLLRIQQNTFHLRWHLLGFLSHGLHVSSSKYPGGRKGAIDRSGGLVVRRTSSATIT